MKKILLCAALALSACAELPASLGAPAGTEVRQVTVWSRVWTVRPEAGKPGYWRASRDWNNLNPYGPPARLRTHQAMRAFRAATGCAPVYTSMYQTITGDVLSQLSCPPAK